MSDVSCELVPSPGTLTQSLVEKAKETLTEGEKEASETFAAMLETPTSSAPASNEEVSSSEESVTLSGKPAPHAVTVCLMNDSLIRIETKTGQRNLGGIAEL